MLGSEAQVAARLLCSCCEFPKGWLKRSQDFSLLWLFCTKKSAVAWSTPTEAVGVTVWSTVSTVVVTILAGNPFLATTFSPPVRQRQPSPTPPPSINYASPPMENIRTLPPPPVHKRIIGTIRDSASSSCASPSWQDYGGPPASHVNGSSSWESSCCPPARHVNGSPSWEGSCCPPTGHVNGSPSWQGGCCPPTGHVNGSPSWEGGCCPPTGHVNGSPSWEGGCCPPAGRENGSPPIKQQAPQGRMLEVVIVKLLTFIFHFICQIEMVKFLTFKFTGCHIELFELSGIVDFIFRQIFRTLKIR